MGMGKAAFACLHFRLRHDAPPAPIDHIFITPDLTAPRAAYLPPGPSDHPALWAVIENP